MSFLETVLPLLGATLLMAFVLGLLLWFVLRRRPGEDDARAAASAEIEALKAAKSALELHLAVEQVRAARAADLEAALSEALDRFDTARDGKSAVDVDLASTKEALAGLQREAADLRERLTVSESTLNQLKLDKATTDETLSARTEALKGSSERGTALQEELAKATAEIATLQTLITKVRTENATLQETLGQERKQADEKIELLRTAREQMSREFKVLADEVMQRHGDNFSKANKEQIDGILTPLREKLGDFEKVVQASNLETVKERTTLTEQIRSIAATGAAMGKETKELTEALRGKSQTQGAWGEMVLNTILDRSGLRAGEEYTVQKSFTTEEGRTLRPDVLVNLPGAHQVVVDAKVSLTAFEAHCNAATEDERDGHLVRHLASIRSHITLLSSKDYHTAAGGTLDYVLMFVPIEGALAAALHADPELMTFALERKVTLTTPTTLMIALRTVANVWQVERRNQNAEEIARRAGLLYDKFVGFALDMVAMGDSINKTRQTFDLAMGKLSTGKGNVVRQIETLKEMGARTSKSLPVALLTAAEGNPVIEADAPREPVLLGVELDPEAA